MIRFYCKIKSFKNVFFNFNLIQFTVQYLLRNLNFITSQALTGCDVNNRTDSITCSQVLESAPHYVTKTGVCF